MFVCGVILNIVFIVNFHKQVKGKDKEFERWRKQKWFASNCFLVLAGATSLTMYRLIYCRLFRLQVMNVKVNRPWPTLVRPILIFTWIKFVVFNVPLIIVDLVGTAPLAWGNQVYMTMVESCVLSFISLALMIWETLKRNELIQREGKQLNMDKMELLGDDDDDGSMAKLTGGFGSVVPGPERLGKGGRKGATPVSIWDALDKPGPATPRTLKLRVEQFQNVLNRIK